MCESGNYVGTLYFLLNFAVNLKLLFFFLNFFFPAALGLCCCTQPFSSYGKWGLLFVVVHRLLIAVASLLAKHGL